MKRAYDNEERPTNKQLLKELQRRTAEKVQKKEKERRRTDQNENKLFAIRSMFLQFLREKDEGASMTEASDEGAPERLEDNSTRWKLDAYGDNPYYKLDRSQIFVGNRYSALLQAINTYRLDISEIIMNQLEIFEDEPEEYDLPEDYDVKVYIDGIVNGEIDTHLLFDKILKEFTEGDNLTIEEVDADDEPNYEANDEPSDEEAERYEEVIEPTKMNYNLFLQDYIKKAKQRAKDIGEEYNISKGFKDGVAAWKRYNQ